MTYVALAEAAAIAAVVIVFSGLLRSSSRAHARREDLLVNQLLNAVGRTWQPPPAAVANVGEERELELAPWSATPEQWPSWGDEAA